MKKQHLVLSLAILLLSACSNGEPGSPPLQLDYSQLGKINLDVQTLNIVDRGNSPSTQSVPYQPSIANAVRRWATDRLQAVGTSGQAVVAIKDANVAAQALPADTGIGSWFERQQASKYKGHVEVEIEAEGREGSALATAEASREVSLPENPSDVERHEAYRTLVEGLMADLNRNLDQAIHDHMQSFIITAPIPPDVPPSSVMPVPESPNQSP